MFHRSRVGLICFVLMPMALTTGRADARSAQPGFPGFFFFAPWASHPARKPVARKRRPDAKSELQHELYRELHRTRPSSGKTRQASLPATAGPPLPPKRPTLQQDGHADRTTDRADAPASAKVRVSALTSGERKLRDELQRTLPPPEAVPEALACAERLAAIARYRPLPRRTVSAPCTAVDLVQLDRVVMPDRTTVALTPPPTLGCGMAEAVAEWIRGDLASAAAELGAPLKSITDNDSYHCRPRNNVKGAKLSEHGKGNALDITAVKLGNGRTFNLTDRHVAKSFRQRVRADACGRFSTVLGPGDPYHAEHIHLDLAERHNGYKICQWDVLEPAQVAKDVPLPPRKPASVTQNEAKPRRKF
jgi:hypothetical protein